MNNGNYVQYLVTNSINSLKAGPSLMYLCRTDKFTGYFCVPIFVIICCFYDKILNIADTYSPQTLNLLHSHR